MPDTRGMYEKYFVERNDGKEIGPRGCIVLEFDDPSAWGAIARWAVEMKIEGREQLAREVHATLQTAKAVVRPRGEATQ